MALRLRTVLLKLRQLFLLSLFELLHGSLMVVELLSAVIIIFLKSFAPYRRRRRLHIRRVDNLVVVIEEKDAVVDLGQLTDGRRLRCRLALLWKCALVLLHEVDNVRTLTFRNGLELVSFAHDLCTVLSERVALGVQQWVELDVLELSPSICVNSEVVHELLFPRDHRALVLVCRCSIRSRVCHRIEALKKLLSSGCGVFVEHVDSRCD